jgi:hypothetical protein
MTGSVILGCATGLALIFSTYAARMLRRVYMEFREAERLATGGAGPELHFVGARSAMSRQRLQAYAANDNSPIVPMAVTGTDVSSTAH